ncbi:hypothetical protein JD292_03390 [Leucobacter sp. CSA2]|uniref:Uncharacterized protein n=1 Tax=Leucobacter edaphi TaxID=2796472 RepID=A0A934QAG4_9MICO|nr:hypothetical protein [Leucobacter edaphi]MBK0421124.1 hypothetical protein [Leucobacter edaphi]
MAKFRLLSLVGVFVVIVLTAGGCSRVGYASEAPQPEQTCDQTLNSAIQQGRSGSTGSHLDSDLQYLADYCPDAYEVAVDYLSSRGGIPSGRLETCATWGTRIRPEAVDLLRADGKCVESTTKRGESRAGGLSWDVAAGFLGAEQRVCGPLVSTRTDNDDVFLNLGRDYPDPARFTIVLWDVGGVEPLPTGTEVCATGTISSYNGVMQIELWDVGAVEVWK